MVTTDIESPIESLSRRAKEADVHMSEICARAKVAQSTPSRWKSGTFEPKFRTVRRLEAAFAELLAEKTTATSAEG